MSFADVLLRTWGPFLLAFLAAVLTAVLFYRLTRRSMARAVEKTPTRIDDLILRPIQPAVYLLIFATTLWMLVTFLPVPVPPSLVDQLPRAGLALAILIVAPIIARLLAGGLKQAARRGYRWERVAIIGGRVAHVVIWLLALLIILGSYGVSITPLLASLGLATVVVALALQDTLANFFAGLWIETERALKPGHFIRVEQPPVEGWIHEVGWRTTRIRTIEQNFVVIPNAQLSQSVVTDFHLPAQQTAIRVPIVVGYETDVELLKRLVFEEVRRKPPIEGIVEQDVHELWFVPGYGEYGLEFTLLLHVLDYPIHYRAVTELRKRLLDRLRREGIRIPIPVRENINLTAAAPRTNVQKAEPPPEP